MTGTSQYYVKSGLVKEKWNARIRVMSFHRERDYNIWSTLNY